MAVDAVTCAGCGATRPAEVIRSTPLPPCPECGATGIQVAMSFSATAGGRARMSAELAPGDQSRDWKHRWAEIQREFRVVSARRTEPLWGDAVHAAAHQLHSFFVQAYHLKDALKAASADHGVPGYDIERAISNDPILAMLADLANLDKHFQLTRPPRSGQTPAIGPARGAMSGEEDGWRLAMTIRHGAEQLDGLEVAAAAVDAWKRQLVGWGLI